MSLSWPRKGSTWRGGEESWCENTIQVQILRVILFFCLFSHSFSRLWSSGSVALEQLWGDTPCPMTKKKPQQDGRRGKIVFRIKPHTRQRCSEGSNILCAHQDPETPKRMRCSVRVQMTLSWNGDVHYAQVLEEVHDIRRSGQGAGRESKRPGTYVFIRIHE